MTEQPRADDRHPPHPDLESGPGNDRDPDYHGRRDRAAHRHRRITARAGRVSNLRLAIFLAGIGALVWAEVRPHTGPVAFAIFAAAVVVFVVLVVVHSRLTQRARVAQELARVNEEALARVQREWSGLPTVPERGEPGHAFAHDLDVFGHASVARLFGTAGTGIGRERLYAWLLEPASTEEARRRQAAVKELVRRLDFRQDLQVAGRLAGNPDRRAIGRFLEWAEGDAWLLARPALLWASRLIPAATLVLGVLQAQGVLERPWWIATLVAGTLLAVAVGRRIHDALDRASLGDASLRHYAGLVDRIQAETFESEPLRAARAALTEPCDARRELERLGWLTELADLRHGGMFYVLIHVPTLWDFHVLAALEHWQRRAGRHVRAWAERIAEVDACAALASPVAEEAGWSFPELAQDGERFVAEGLAHPMLPAGRRVPNDVVVGPPGTFLMVTGSNMSGKSTLLRAIGVNAVLALAGGPVCARRLRTPPLDIRTSMRVEDSLEEGVSLFMAELQQLKRVVDAADAAGHGDDPAHHDVADAPLVLYLLDEILHGTNSAERQVAVRRVIAHLLESRAIGAISTHDLELANAEPLASAVVPVHFRETVHPEGHEPPMTFDYVLRDGVATSTNALKLVRLVGLA